MKENQERPSTPPVTPFPQTPVLPSKNWLKILLFALLGVVVIVGLPLAGIQIGKNQASILESKTKASVLPTPTINPATNWKTYKYQFDDKDYMTFKYPTDAKTEESSNSGQFSIKVTLVEGIPNKEETLEVQLIKMVNGPEEKYSPDYRLRQDLKLNQPLVSGVKPAQIGCLPTYEHYKVECGDWGVSCVKTSTYYSNPMNYGVKIIAKHTIGNDSLIEKEFEDYILNQIVSSIRFKETGHENSCP